METSEDQAYTGTEDQHIPIDLFGSKKHAGVPRGILAFADASGNIVFKVHLQPPNPNSSSPKDTKLLLDSNDNPLFFIHHQHKGIWKCYKGSSDGNKELVLEVKRTVKTLTRVELEVVFAGERLNDDVCDLKVIGSPFKRSCSISKDGDLVAQVYGCKVYIGERERESAVKNGGETVSVSYYRRFRQPPTSIIEILKNDKHADW